MELAATDIPIVKGIRYFTGLFCTQNNKQALEEFSKAYRSEGSLFSGLMRANLLLIENSSSSTEKAIKIYQELCNDSISARYNYAYCCELGLVHQGDSEKRAFMTYKELCEKADFKRAAYRLGICYYYGIGTSKNKIAARKIFTNLIEAGYKKSTSLLAQMYESGDGVTKDVQKALVLYNNQIPGSLSTPYGFIEQDEISFGPFLDIICGYAPTENDFFDHDLLEYFQTKGSDDNEKKEDVLRKLCANDFVDANIELVLSLCAQKTIPFEAIDITVRNAYTNGSIKSFEFLRSIIATDKIEQLYAFGKNAKNYHSSMSIAHIYEKFISQNREKNDRVVFEYICLLHFGVLSKEKNDAKAFELVKEISKNFCNDMYVVERMILGAHFTLYISNISEIEKERYEWLFVNPRNWHDCQKILYILKTSPNVSEEKDNLLEIAKTIESKKISAYIIGLIYEKAEKIHAAMSYYTMALEIVDDVFIKRVARDFFEKLFEDNVIECVLSYHIPRKLELAIGRKAGDYYWESGVFDKASLAYKKAEEEGDVLAGFSYERTEIISGKLIIDAQKITRFITDSTIKGLFDIYCSIYNDFRGDIVKVDNFLLSKLTGNIVAEWFIKVFENKERTHESVYNILQSGNLVFHQHDHNYMFLNIRGDNTKEKSYIYFERLYYGRGIVKKTDEAFANLKKLSDKGYIPAQIKIADIYSDQNSKFFNINNAIDIYHKNALNGNIQSYQRLYDIGKRGLKNMNGETLDRLRIASAMEALKHENRKLYIRKIINILSALAFVLLAVFISACADSIENDTETVETSAFLTSIEETNVYSESIEIGKDLTINLLIEDWIGWKPIIDANGGLYTAKDSIYKKTYDIDVNIVSQTPNELTVQELSDALISGNYNAIGCTVNQYAEIYPLLQEADIKAYVVYTPASSCGWDYLLSNNTINIFDSYLVPVISSLSNSNSLFLALSYFYNVRNDIFPNIIGSLQLHDTIDNSVIAYNDGRATWLALDHNINILSSTPKGTIVYDTKQNPDAVIGVIIVTEAVKNNNNLVNGFVKGAINTITKFENDYTDNYKYIKEMKTYNSLSDELFEEIIQFVKFSDENDNVDILYRKNYAQDAFENSSLFISLMNNYNTDVMAKWNNSVYYLGAIPAIIEGDSKEITSFVLAGAIGVINEADRSIEVTVPYGTIVTNLVPAIKHSGINISPSASTAHNFTNPLVFTVTGENKTQKAYIVTVKKATSSKKVITAFGLGNTEGVINEAAGTIEITVPYNTDITRLIPDIKYTGASIYPLETKPCNFTNTVTYTVTAQDNTLKKYKVIVNKLLKKEIDVKFRGWSDEFENEAEVRANLSAVVAELKEMTGYSVAVYGYVSLMNNESISIEGVELSQKRASRIKEYLIESGIDESRIIAKSGGGIHSYDQNASNRKVIIEYTIKK